MQYISDIHLEFCKKEKTYLMLVNNILKNKGNSKYIALIGDIGNPFKNNYNRFISDLSKEYEKVIVVAGNHEYYSNTPMPIVKQKIRKICRENNTIFLDNDITYLPGSKKSSKGPKKTSPKKKPKKRTKIIGTTLWSHIPENYTTKVEYFINDYHKIFTKVDTKFTTKDSNKLHQEAIDFIESELAESLEKGEEVIILSHHAPLLKNTSSPKYENQPTNYAFATDLSHLIKKPIKAWCFGHTHWQTNFIYNNVAILSNPVGYGGELSRQKVQWSSYIDL